MTDIEKLNIAIKESPYKIGYLAKACNLSRSGLSNKIKGKHFFNQYEIETLSYLLGLNKEEIFFAQKVD